MNFRKKYLYARTTHTNFRATRRKEKIPVLELADLVKVSDVTIRKDLAALEEKGLLKREHGFATMPESNDISTRMLFNYEKKRRIARKALESISNEETLVNYPNRGFQRRSVWACLLASIR